MTLEFILLIIFALIILLQSFVMYIMYVRIRQLLRDEDVNLNERELDELIRNIEDFTQMRNQM